MRYAIPPLAIACAVSFWTGAGSAQNQWVAPLTDCGGAGLLIQRNYRAAALADDPGAQLMFQQGLSLFYQSLRLMGEVTQCNATYDETHDAMIQAALAIQAAVVADIGADATDDQVQSALLGRVAQCWQTLSAPILPGAMVRLGQEGVGCGWSVGED